MEGGFHDPPIASARACHYSRRLPPTSANFHGPRRPPDPGQHISTGTRPRISLPPPSTGIRQFPPIHFPWVRLEYLTKFKAFRILRAAWVASFRRHFAFLNSVGNSFWYAWKVDRITRCASC